MVNYVDFEGNPLKEDGVYDDSNKKTYGEPALSHLCALESVKEESFTLKYLDGKTMRIEMEPELYIYSRKLIPVRKDEIQSKFTELELARSNLTQMVKNIPGD